MTDEKILKKVGKLLKIYGVDDKEIDKFVLDLQDKKYDDQDATEEVVEEEKPAEGEEVDKVEEKKDDAEEAEPKEEVEDKVEEKVEDKQGDEQEVVKEDEKLEEEPSEDKPIEQEDHEEVKKTIEGLVARIESLEDVVKKLGSPVEEGFGERPVNEGSVGAQESAFDHYNHLRR